MCDGHKINGKLYGIGIGPGDPKLLTLRAKEILDKVETIFVPKGKEAGTSCARAIIEQVVTGDKNFEELIFPMTMDKGILKESWREAADRIARKIREKREAVFVTIGDPFIYSTYIYLLKTLQQNFPDIEVETVPGITAFNAAAARAQFPLVEGEEKLAVLPVTEDFEILRKALKEFDTVVLMKIGRRLNDVLGLLKELGLIRSAILVSRVGQADEVVVRDIAKLKDEGLGYLSVIIVRTGL